MLGVVVLLPPLVLVAAGRARGAAGVVGVVVLVVLVVLAAERQQQHPRTKTSLMRN